MCTGAPTGTLEFAKLKEQAKKDQQTIKILEERIVGLEETNRELKKDKDFLMSQLKAPSQSPVSSQMPGSRKTAEVLSSSPSSGSPAPSSNSSSFSSSELEEMEKKKKKKKKKSKGHIDAQSRSRITSPDGVIRRYKKAMKKFSKCGSMKRAFSAINVDRNTIARTAIIAELAITFPDVYKGLLCDGDHTKISEFAECLCFAPQWSGSLSRVYPPPIVRRMLEIGTSRPP
ncbi:coiled-coil domain-containing protein 106-like [Gouania willdenowi]|uniref:coiled-coil domain-containing protein 106-like n=1 Tax=Gouania willdenowi TaxID=441366 RepID=UPI001056CA44|nr:coiled-coil domain-containing protein 106-like [Gouania willdenowi]